MQLLYISFLLLSIGYTAAQQVLPLNIFLSEFTAVIDSYETGASLYLTSNENAEQLKNIVITNGAQKMTAYQISRLHSPLDMKTPWPLDTSSISIKTTNNDTVSRNIEGVIYITTAAQAKDENFLVYDVTDKLFIDRTLSPKSTLVFMNVNLWSRQQPQVFMPQWSSYVSGVEHAQKSQLTIFHGIPATNYVVERENNKIFSNPLIANLPAKTELFFTNIEPLQINSKIWYLTCDGSISLTVEGTWKNNANYDATAGTTTGILTAEEGFFVNTTVTLPVMPGMRASSGFSVNYNLFNPMNLEMIDVAGASLSSGINDLYNWNTTRMDQSSFQAKTFTVTSPFAFVGSYYIQYYKSEYPANPTSTSPTSTSPTSTSPMTTTQTPANGGTTSRPVISTSTVQATTKSANGVTTILTVFTLLILYIV